MNSFKRKRFGFVFGYGSDTEADVIKALTDRHPEYIGDAVLNGYELRIQYLDEISDVTVKKILRNAWDDNFRSYVIIENPAKSVMGKLYKIWIGDRHALDEWELVDLGWYQKVFVDVELTRNGKRYRAETQVLAPGSSARGTVPDGEVKHPWLQPKRQFIQTAEKLRDLQR